MDPGPANSTALEQGCTQHCTAPSIDPSVKGTTNDPERPQPLHNGHTVASCLNWERGGGDSCEWWACSPPSSPHHPQRWSKQKASGAAGFPPPPTKASLGHKAEAGQKGQEEVLVLLLGEMTSPSHSLPPSEVSLAQPTSCPQNTESLW